MVTGLIILFSVIIMIKFGEQDSIRGPLINESNPAQGYAGTGATATYNNTYDTITDFSTWLPTIGLLAVASIIIYLIVRSFMPMTR